MPEKTAFIAIVGRPNVGKSSLLNGLLGQKVAIVSDKPQTTRTRIMGVYTHEDTQLVFIDTPGLHKPRTKLGQNMVKAVRDGMDGVDACLLVVEALPAGSGKVAPAERDLIGRFQKEKIPAVLCINKIDLLPDKTALLPRILDFSSLYDFAAVVPASAVTGEGVPDLLSELSALSVESPHAFDPDTLTDQPERQIAAEIVREKLLLLLDQEVPHGIAVGIEKFRERPAKDGAEGGILDVEATIYCERESHKGIIIGRQGAMLKKAGSAAREDMERFFQCKVNLQLWVKVKEDWRNREAQLHNFGLD